jgi:hypothetical protein
VTAIQLYTHVVRELDVSQLPVDRAISVGKHGKLQAIFFFELSHLLDRIAGADGDELQPPLEFWAAFNLCIQLVHLGRVFVAQWTVDTEQLDNHNVGLDLIHRKKARSGNAEIFRQAPVLRDGQLDNRENIPCACRFIFFIGNFCGCTGPQRRAVNTVMNAIPFFMNCLFQCLGWGIEGMFCRPFFIVGLGIPTLMPLSHKPDRAG